MTSGLAAVLDSSVVLDALVASGAAGSAARERLRSLGVLPAPHLLDVEVSSVLRRLVLAGRVGTSIALRAQASFAQLPVERYPFAPFAGRVWELRDQVTAYDGWYVALAERLGVALVTTDERLQRSTLPRCPVVAP